MGALRWAPAPSSAEGHRKKDAAVFFLLVYSLAIKYFAIITFVAQTKTMALATSSKSVTSFSSG